MNIKKFVFVLAVIFGTSAVAQATDRFVGSTSAYSGDKPIAVGRSDLWIPTVHQTGKAGIGFASSKFFGHQFIVDLGGVASHTDKKYQVDGVTVYNNVKGNGDTTHQRFGNFNFVQVGNQDVWYGEWSTDGAKSWGERQAFYVGDTQNTTVPTSGFATYNVHGINKFTGSNVLKGNFNANFGAKQLSGVLSGNGMTIHATAKIDGTTFAGQATATGNVAESGHVNGRFFGKDASGLAGLATFENKDLDTAFGGTKR